MREVPLEVFLSFPPPNYDNPVTRGDALTITHGVFMGIVISVVGVRLYTRLAINRRLGWDDIWIIPATIFTVALAALVILSHTKYNWNKHIYDVPPSQIPQLGKTAMAAKTLFTLAAVFTRQSLLSFYYRLIGETSLKHFRNVLHAATVFNVVTGIVFVALCLFPCRPISAYWDFPAHGHCLDDGKTTLGAGIVNCICDLLTTTLPIPIIMQLRMPLKHRLGVAFLLSLGFIVTIAGIVRSFYVWKSMMASYDETWYSYPLWIAGVVEIDLAVITACVPGLRPFLLVYIRPLFRPIERLTSKVHGSLSTTGLSTTSSSKRHSKRHSKVPAGLPVYNAPAPAPTPTPEPAAKPLAIMRRQSFELTEGVVEEGSPDARSVNTVLEGAGKRSLLDWVLGRRGGEERRGSEKDIVGGAAPVGTGGVMKEW